MSIYVRRLAGCGCVRSLRHPLEDFQNGSGGGVGRCSMDFASPIAFVAWIRACETLDFQS